MRESSNKKMTTEELKYNIIEELIEIKNEEIFGIHEEIQMIWKFEILIASRYSIYLPTILTHLLYFHFLIILTACNLLNIRVNYFE